MNGLQEAWEEAWKKSNLDYFPFLPTSETARIPLDVWAKLAEKSQGKAGGVSSTLAELETSMPTTSIPGPFNVRIEQDGKNHFIVVEPIPAMTSSEADALARQLCAAAERIRQMTKRKWTWGDTR